MRRLMVGVLLLAGCGQIAGPTPARVQRQKAAKTVWALELFQQWEANAVKTETSYKNQWINARGRGIGVQRVDGDAFVMMNGYHQGEMREVLRAYVDKADEAHLADIDPNGWLQAEGLCEGPGAVTNGVIVLRHARISPAPNNENP